MLYGRILLDATLETDLAGTSKPDLLQLKEASSGLEVKIRDLRQWNCIKRHLMIGEGGYLCQSSSPALRIPCIEEWTDIFINNHIDGILHRSLQDTISSIQALWCTSVREYGLPKVFIESVVKDCGCQNDARQAISQLVTPSEDVPHALNVIQIQFRTRLMKWKWASPNVDVFVCHRFGQPRRRGSRIRRTRQSKKCGCNFSVFVRKRMHRGKSWAEITVYGPHRGHNPLDNFEVLHLPVHPTIIDCCMDDLFDVGCVLHVAKMSIRKEMMHKHKASPTDQVTHRFFMLPKEIQNHATKLKVGTTMSDSDWVAMMHDAQALVRNGKVLHLQS